MKRIVGLLLILPALILWIVQLVVPTFRTALLSLQDAAPIGDKPATFVGLENYVVILDETVLTAFFNVLLFTAPTIVITLALGLLIGAFAARGSVLVRRITRGILGLGLVLYAPIGVALAREFTFDGSLPQIVLSVPIAIIVALLASTGSAAGLASIAAWRSGAATWLAVAGVILTVGLGLGAQLLALPLVLTGGGPQRATETPMLLATTLGLQQLRFGPAAAMSVVVWVIVAFWGLLAVAIIVLSRLRLEIETTRPPERGSGIGWLGPGVAGLFMVIMIVLLMPWLAASAQPASPDLPAMILANTWLPSLVGTVVQLIIALAAGFGLGALRPLGRFSEAGLLIFAPWLLAGEGILMLQHFEWLRSLDLLNTWAGLLPTSMINIPAVIAFTLLFAAVGRVRERGAPPAAVAAPMLGVGLTTFVLLWLIQAQSLITSYVNAGNPDSMNGPMALLMARRQYQTETLPQSLNTPLPWLIVLALGSIAIQVFLMDRLKLATGAALPAVDDHSERARTLS